MEREIDDRIQMRQIFGMAGLFLTAAIGWVSFAYYPDYPDETLYVISILSTLAISGFLSFYAWRQREVTGALLFMLMELGVSFLALFEIMSILSQTREQALFWFNMRFLLTAFIPVGWLAFVLTFSGQLRLVSKPLVAGMLVIPAITQLMMWSNSLHGLWVTHDVGFHQAGSFWIAETSARVPAVWFMVHSFYSLLLGLIAAGFLLQIAWKKRQTYRAQALLFTVGTLISLSASVIPIFNLIPESVFNPFIPGLGISALCYALVVFRFDFLKGLTRGETRYLTSTMDPASFRSMLLFIFIFVLMATGLTSIGYISYQNYERQFRNQVESELSAIAELKINDLENWRTERLGDARILKENPALAALVQRAFENPADEQAQADLQAWLQSIVGNSQYDRVSLLDTQAVERFSAPDSPRSSPAHSQDVQEVIGTKQIAFLDFHRDVKDASIHLAILIPLLSGNEADTLVGVLYLGIDPEKHLYPLINEWPGPSATAETLIVRTDGNNILYLNDLRFDPSAALNLRIPLVELDVPAVRVANGQEGIFEGMDYRGVPVLADAHPVPNTPWFLVSKIDTAEVFAPLRKRAWETFFLVVAWILGAGAGLGVIWRQQRLRYYRAQYETAESLRKFEERYRDLVQQASDGIFLTDPQTHYIEVNQRGCDMLGYSRSEILTMKIADLIPPEDLTHNPPRLQELREGKTLITERRLKRKDGSLLPVEISASMFPDGRFQSIIRDITERKQAEEKLRESEENYRFLLNNTSDFIARFDQNGVLVFATEASLRFNGYRPDEIVNTLSFDRIHPEDRDKARDELKRVIETNGEGRVEYRLKRKDGAYIWVEANGRRVLNAAGEPEVILAQRDITERKLAEEKLRASEFRFRLAAESLTDVIYEWDIKEKIDWYGEIDGLMGYAPGTFPRTLSGWVALLHPDDKEYVQFAIDAQLKGEEPYNIEYRVKNMDGEWRWWAARGIVLRDQQGTPYHWIGSITDITERKQAEEALRNSEEKFRTVADFTYDWEYWVNVSGKMIYVSPSCERISGHSAAEFLADTHLLERIIHPDDLVLYQRHIHEEFSRTEATSIDFRITKPDGETRWVNHVCQLVRGADGRWLGRRASNRDITIRKQAEEQLAYQAFLLEHVNDAILATDGQRIITSWNLAAEKMFGWTKEEAIGRFAEEIIFTEITAEQRDWAMKQLAETGEYKAEVLVTRKDGSKIWVEGVNSPLHGRDGEILGYISINRDITDRKQAEQALKRNERVLRLFVEHSPAAIAMFDRDMRYIVHSRRYVRDYRLPDADLTGRSYYDVFPEVPKRWKEIHRSCLAGQIERTEEDPFPRADGHLDYVHWELHPWYEDTGAIGGVILFSEVITERVQAREALLQSETRLKEAQHMGRIGHWEWTAPGGDIHCSDELFDIFEIPRTDSGDISRSTMNELIATDDRQRLVEMDRAAFASRSNTDYRFKIRLPDGRIRWLHQQIRITYSEDGKPARMMGIVQDITESKQAEETLKESEERFSTAFHTNPVSQSIITLETSEILMVNDACCSLFGYPREELIGARTADLHLWANPAEEMSAMEEFLREGRMRAREATIRLKSGGLRTIIAEITPISWKGFPCLITSAFDITERKQAEAALTQRLAELELLYQSGLALSGELESKQVAEKLIEALEANLDWHHLAIRKYDSESGLLELLAFKHPSLENEAQTKAAEKRFNEAVPNSSQGLSGWVVRNGQAVRSGNVQADERYTETYPGIASGLYTPMLLGERVVGVISVESKELNAFTESDERLLKTIANQAAVAFENARLFQSLENELTERIQAEKALRTSEERMRLILQTTSDGFWVTDSNAKFLDVNNAYCEMSGYSRAELLEMRLPDVEAYESMRDTEQHIKQILNQGVDLFETRHRRKDGTEFDVEISVNLLDEESRVMICFCRDITARKQAEREIRQHNEDLLLINTLNEAANRGETVEAILEIFANETRTMFDCQDAAVYLVSPDGKYLDMQSTTVTARVSQQIESIIGIKIPRIRIPIRPGGYTQAVLANKEGFLTTDPAEIQKWIAEFTETTFLPAALRTATKRLIPHIHKFLNMRSTITVPLLSTDHTIGLLDISSQGDLTLDNLRRVRVLSQQITAIILRKQAEANVQMQLRRITALNEIDRAINSILDIHLSLDVILNVVLSQLNVDAAAVLFLNEEDQMLEFFAGRGFRSQTSRHPQLARGEDFAGQVALERKLLHFENITALPNQFKRIETFKDDAFFEYYGVPLIAKGILKGVLEIFNRTPLLPDQDWLHYLEALGGQAAIAIDNSQLFEGIQRSNQELVAAYDATIAGWSHAMDLRDKETEGHSQRVTDLTLRLAKRLGVSEQERAQMRRGALLHDIGKLGVPDHILFKPGKLTDEEWEIMQRHPTYAFEMLEPIRYLRPALDIPYCHHEKWNGTGYPRKLREEQIPLAARIFAIVDVWDALRSDRPYRAGWSAQKTRDYIQAESGKHFDPQVVQAFLQMLDELPPDLSSGAEN